MTNLTAKCIIAAVVPVYKPSREDYERVASYVGQVDFCIIQDDSPEDGFGFFTSFFNDFDLDVCYHWNGKNLGLVSSLNNGFASAMNRGAAWILVMNPDGSLEHDYVSCFRRFIQAHETSGVAALVPTYSTARHHACPKEGYKEVSYGDMSGTLFSCSALADLGLYDPKTYFYGCDSEWCLRAKSRGYKLIEVSDALIHHNPGTTCSFRVLGKDIFLYGKDSPVRYYYQFRSGYYIHSLYHNVKQDAFIFYKFLKVLFLFDNKREYLRLHKAAKIDFKRGYFGSYYSRCK